MGFWSDKIVDDNSRDTTLAAVLKRIDDQTQMLDEWTEKVPSPVLKAAVKKAQITSPLDKGFEDEIMAKEWWPDWQKVKKEIKRREDNHTIPTERIVREQVARHIWQCGACGSNTADKDTVLDALEILGLENLVESAFKHKMADAARVEKNAEGDTMPQEGEDPRSSSEADDEKSNTELSPDAPSVQSPSLNDTSL